MKKKYTEPTIAIFTVNVNQIVAASSVEFATGENYNAEQYDDTERLLRGGGDADARDNIFDNNHSVWDNAW